MYLSLLGKLSLWNIFIVIVAQAKSNVMKQETEL